MYIQLSTQVQATTTRGSTDMKLIKKTTGLFRDTSGETMVEVLVAFTLLSIMLIVFSQGLASATSSEANAKKNRDNADSTMIELQKKLVSDTPTVSSGNITVEQKATYTIGTGSIKSYKYTVDGNTYVVFVPGT